MWLFWRPRNRFSLDELRYLIDQLQKVQVVNESNKDFVVEALRSIAELVTYGDQHDPSYFEYFMEKQIMGVFAHILRAGCPAKVALQLLQTMSIMIQNLRSQQSIYYIFSSEYINYLITYSFDFENEEILSFYISFLRAISGKLNKGTISLLVKTKNDEVVSFPLYAEAIKFAFHEETMIRIAVRALTLNIYHVGDQSVNKFVTREPLSYYFSDIVKNFQKQCIKLDKLVSQFMSSSGDNASSLDSGLVLDEVEEIEESLYYFSDVMSSDVPDLGGLIASNILSLLVFPLLLPALEVHCNISQIGTTTALYLLCRILQVFKSKDLASTVAVRLFCLSSYSNPNTKSQTEPNGSASDCFVSEFSRTVATDAQTDTENMGIHMSNVSSSSRLICNNSPQRFSIHGSTLRELLLTYIVSANDLLALGSLCFFSTLLQTKELDETILDRLGILPQRKQHKKLLLQALVGDDLAEEQLFATDNGSKNDSPSNEFCTYLTKLETHYELHPNREIDPKLHHYQMLDALVSLFCRYDIAADVCWVGGWLFRQLLPHGKEEFNIFQLRKLKDAFFSSATKVAEEIRGCWCDLLFVVIKHAWQNCKKGIEASYPPKEFKSLLLPLDSASYTGEHMRGECSVASGERMHEMLKVFVLRRQLLMFCVGQIPGDEPLTQSTLNSPARLQNTSSDFDGSIPKSGCEVDLDGAIPCRIAFERGKERQLNLLVLLMGTLGYMVLVDESAVNQQRGIIRVVAPLAGADPRIDEQHPKWLNLRIRPPSLPFLDTLRNCSFGRKSKGNYLVDGRWILAFRDQDSCKSAESMILEKMRLQQTTVEMQLKPLLDFDMPGD